MKKLEHGGNIYQYNNKITDFSANINPLGMPESVKKAITHNIDSYECYPDTQNLELTKSLSEYYNVPKDLIVCGNGAADIIYKIALAFKPKKALIVSPTFSEYETALNLVNCDANHYLLTEENMFEMQTDFLDYDINIYDIIFICNPNNPTGIPISSEIIKAIADKCAKNNTILVIDECFVEFSEDEENFSVVDFITNMPTTIILKAFTKIYAMAGIRLGYAICGNIDYVQKISITLQPWSVSTVASKCGVAALKEIDFIKNTKIYIKENREYLIKSLKSLGFIVYNSKANYVFFKSNIPLAGHLEKRNILIRSCDNYISLNENFYRIAVKTNEENLYLIKCLTEILEEN